MRSMMWRSASSLALLTLLTAGVAAAQTTYPNVKMAGRLQVEFYDFNNGENAIYAALPAAARAPESSFLIRRARIEAKGNLTENITFVIQPNYTTGQSGVTLKDAYLDVSFTKPEAKSAFALRAGQFKRFFGRYELTSSNNLPSIERGAYRGLVPVSSNDLAVGNGFEAHDIGAGLMYTGLTKRLAVDGRRHERRALTEQHRPEQRQVVLRPRHLRHHADALDRRFRRQPRLRASGRTRPSRLTARRRTPAGASTPSGALRATRGCT